MNLEKKINPLLDDNDLVSLSYIFSEIMEKTVKTMQVQQAKIIMCIVHPKYKIVKLIFFPNIAIAILDFSLLRPYSYHSSNLR